MLRDKNAVVKYHDPYIPLIKNLRKYPELELTSVELTEHLLSHQDCVLIITEHSVIDYQFVFNHSKLIIDTRNVLKDIVSSKIVKA